MSIPKNQQFVLEFAKLGEIVDGILHMPTLYNLNNRGVYRTWDLFIAIENLKGNVLAITDGYINRDPLPKGYIGVYWTESGEEEGTITVHSKTPIETGKYGTNSNRTTPFTQAILDARSKYNKKIKEGAVSDKSLLKKNGEQNTIDELISKKHRGDKPWRIFTMAYHDLQKPNVWSHVKYPCSVQYKLDGTLAIVVYHPSLPEISITDGDQTKYVHMDCYSRGRESIEQQKDHILMEMHDTLIKYPGLHIVGELWKKGYSLQEISGSSRRLTDSKLGEASIKYDFNAFDCFYIDKPYTFEERYGLLEDVHMEKDNYNYFKMIPTNEARNKNEIMTLYNSYLDEGYEGAIIRNNDGLYEVGIDRELRSYNTLKLKPRFDDEFPIVNFKEGTKGKDIGALIWICAENDKGVEQRAGKVLPLDDRKTFSFTPNMDYELRYNIFKFLKNNPAYFEKNIKGQPYTVNYSILSDMYLPQQPKGKGFRELKVNEQLIQDATDYTSKI